jgi:hypothetical protein
MERQRPRTFRHRSYCDVTTDVTDDISDIADKDVAGVGAYGEPVVVLGSAGGGASVERVPGERVYKFLCHTNDA